MERQEPPEKHGAQTRRDHVDCDHLPTSVRVAMETVPVLASFDSSSSGAIATFLDRPIHPLAYAIVPPFAGSIPTGRLLQA
jgi:hypothetical protein